MRPLSEHDLLLLAGMSVLQFELYCQSSVYLNYVVHIEISTPENERPHCIYKLTKPKGRVTALTAGWFESEMNYDLFCNIQCYKHKG